jgi:hypothetical protein
MSVGLGLHGPLESKTLGTGVAPRGRVAAALIPRTSGRPSAGHHGDAELPFPRVGIVRPCLARARDSAARPLRFCGCELTETYSRVCDQPGRRVEESGARGADLHGPVRQALRVAPARTTACHPLQARRVLRKLVPPYSAGVPSPPLQPVRSPQPYQEFESIDLQAMAPQQRIAPIRNLRRRGLVARGLRRQSRTRAAPRPVPLRSRPTVRFSSLGRDGAISAANTYTRAWPKEPGPPQIRGIDSGNGRLTRRRRCTRTPSA